MGVVRTGWLGGLAAAVMLIGAIPANAAQFNGQPDAICNSLSAFDLVDNGDARFAETFSVGHTGKLVGASLWVDKSAANPETDYLLRVTDLDPARAPTDHVLSTGTIRMAGIAANLASGSRLTLLTPLPVIAGQRYALVVTRPGAGTDGLRVGLATGPTCTGSLFTSDSPVGPWLPDPDDLFLVTRVDAAPVVHVVKRPKKRTRKRKATIKFQAFDGGGLGATFNCSFDRAPLAPCTSPAIFKHLQPGKHRFTVQATDTAGSVSEPLTLKWRVKG
jgi:hypothetical protein